MRQHKTAAIWTTIPVQVASAYASLGEVKLIPLTDHWATRRFAVCFKDEKELQAAAVRVVDHLASRASA